MGKWKLKHRMGILLAVVILDSAVFGMSAGVMNYLSRTPENGGVTEGRGLEAGGMARAGEKPLPGEAPVLGGGSQGSQSNRSQSNRSQSNSGQSNGSQNNAGKKQIALTFDDGPHSEYTLKLLEGLKERNVRATFFLMGQNIPGNEELIRRCRRTAILSATTATAMCS